MSGRGANPLGGGGGSGGRASNGRGSGGGGGGGGFGGGGGSGNRNTPPAMGGAGSGPRADRSGGGARSGQGSGQEMGGSFGGSGRAHTGMERMRHIGRAERDEHPFLWDKLNDRGKTCLSFGVPPKVRNNRWKEDDRDTGQGRCKFNRDCRVFDGPDHTDPKPERIRDRINSRGNLVLCAAVENVPIESIHPNYQHHDKPRDPHHERAPQPPFKGVGGHRTPFWSSHVEFNLGHSHAAGLHPYQQCKGKYGQLPFGQTGKVFEYTEKRRMMVRKVFHAVAGRGNATEVTVEVLLRRFQARRVSAVVARQMSEAEATKEMLRRLTGDEEVENGRKVTGEEFEAMYKKESDEIKDDGYFALLLHNEWN